MALLKVDFVSDWLQHLRERLREVWGDQVDPIKPEDLPSRFFDSFRRAIPPAPRQLHCSDVFSIPPEHLPGWNFLARKVTNGEDLRPHLSKGHQQLTNQDGLLNDWGIHHFHLGLAPQQGKPHLITRTGPVALAYVTNDAFYALGIYPHSPAPWSRSELVEVIHRNWPNAIAQFRVAGISASPVNEVQRTTLRAKHCSVFTATLDGTIYAPLGGAVTGAGTDIQSVRQGDIWRTEIERLQADCIRQAETFFCALESVGKSPLHELEGKLRFTPDGYAIEFPAHGVLVEINWEAVAE